jgi:large subunit ribosomal protein L6
MNVKNFTQELKIPEGITITVEKGIVTVKGPEGEVIKKLLSPIVKIEIKDNNVVFNIAKMTKREKTILGTFTSHINNMIKGVQEPYVYKLKVCSGHFPMNINIANGKLSIKNFIGEKVPRVLKLKEGADVKMEGEVITVTSVSKEIAGHVASDIELLTRRPGFDSRIFQQGIFITEKAGKAV